MKSVYIVLICSVIAYETEIHTYNAPIVREPIGECVKLTAMFYYKYNKTTEKVTWRKDMKPLKNNERETVSGKRLSITSLRSSDFAFYQVIVEGFLLGDPNLKVKETTNFWVNTQGCGVNQKEKVPTSAQSCEKLCVDTCPLGWIYVPGTVRKCIKYVATPQAWLKADEMCQDMGAVLPTIATHSENKFLASKLQTGDGGWIGLNDRIEESNYVWNFNLKNTPNFFTWGKGEPNNYNRDCNIENCVSIKKGSRRWNDVICGAFNSFICEVEKGSLNETDKKDWSCIGHKCFKYFRYYLIWHEALRTCQSMHSSGKLATIFSQAENGFVAELIVGNLQHNAWIGLNDIWEAGSYSWNKYRGKPIKSWYTNWDDGEPNDKYTLPFAEKCVGEDCVQLKGTGGNATWQDLSCKTKLPYLCEKIGEGTYTTGGIVSMVIGSLILLATIVGFTHVTYENRKRTAVKDIIREAYTEDLSSREYNINSNRKFSDKKLKI